MYYPVILYTVSNERGLNLMALDIKFVRKILSTNVAEQFICNGSYYCGTIISQPFLDKLIQAKQAVNLIGEDCQQRATLYYVSVGFKSDTSSFVDYVVAVKKHTKKGVVDGL